MGALQVEGVEQANRVRDQIAECVLRSARLVADRPASVAVVVANDEPGTGRETLTELVLPSEHRSGRSVDEEDRGSGAIAEGLDAEVHPVGPDDPLVGLRRPNLGTCCWRLLLREPGVVAVRHNGFSFR